MVKISVIIPVYNTEKYLPQCLDSIINQTLTDIEILCVNDGSKDNSEEILKDYARKDSRIKIITQTNKGQGAARNNALSKAIGEYIYFMDSDDMLKITALNELYNIATDKKLDMIIFKLINIEEETSKKYSEKYYDMRFLKNLVGDEVFNYNDVGGDLYYIAVSPPGKLFKKSLIQDIRFDESLIFEDNPFFIEAFFKAQRVYFHDEYLYYRLRREGSIMTSNASYMDIIPISNKIIDITKKYNHFNEFKDKLFNKKIFSTYYRFTLLEGEIKEKYYNEMKKDLQKHQKEINPLKLTNLNKYILQKILSCEDYLEFENNIEAFRNEEKKLKKNLRQVKKNEIARIDIKNYGDKTNTLQILENSDENSTQNFKKWFSNEKGSGVVVESEKGNIDLKLKMINDGKLKLKLRSIALKDENIKSCVDYTSLIINGEEQLQTHTLGYHKKPYVFKKTVEDSQVIDIHIEWVTYDKLNDLYKDMDDKNKKHDKLSWESFKLIDKLDKKDLENKKLKKELDKIHSSIFWKITHPF